MGYVKNELLYSYKEIKRIKMSVINIIGDVGQGKTLLMTKWSLNLDCPVYSNYEIKIPNYIPLTPEMLYDINKDEQRGTKCIVNLDEVYAWLESRSSGKPINIYMSYILFQSRKRGIEFRLSEQLLSSLETRFRQMINYEIYCEAFGNEDDPDFFKYTIREMKYYKSKKPLIYIITREQAKLIYPLYNSWEKVDPIDKELMYKISEDKEPIMEEIDIIVSELLSKYNSQKVTKGIVQDICIEKKLPPKTYGDLIYNRLKRRALENV